MRRNISSRIFAVVGLALFAAGGFASVILPGTAEATGAVNKPASFARVRDNKQKTGKVKITKVTVLDKFGHPKQVTWRVVGGAGTPNPTVKISPPLENGEYVSMEMTTANAGPFTTLDLFFY